MQIRELSGTEVDAVAGGSVEFNGSGNGLIATPIGFKPQPDPWRFKPEPDPWRFDPEPAPWHVGP